MTHTGTRIMKKLFLHYDSSCVEMDTDEAQLFVL